MTGRTRLALLALLTGIALLIGVPLYRATSKPTLYDYTVCYSDPELCFSGRAPDDGTLWLAEVRFVDCCPLAMRTDKLGRVELDKLNTATLEALGFFIPKDGHDRGSDMWEYESSRGIPGLHCLCRVTRAEEVTRFRCDVRSTDHHLSRSPDAKGDVEFETYGLEPKEFYLPIRFADVQRILGAPASVTKTEVER